MDNQIQGDEEFDINKKIYWVRHAESCANIASIFNNIDAKIKHPILTNKGIQQSILLGTNYINNLENLRCGFSSPVARTIMTALVSMRTYYYKNNNFIIKVTPYISENLNIAGDYDKQNSIMSPLKIKLMIKLIKDWLEKFWLIEYDDYEFTDLLDKIKNNNNEILNVIIKNIYDNINIMKTINLQEINVLNIYQLNIKNLINDLIVNSETIDDNIKKYINELIKFTNSKFFRGPKIDTLDYDKLYQNYVPKSYETNTQRFNEFYVNMVNKTNNIICFSHGNILRDIFFNKISNTNSIDLFSISNSSGKICLKYTSIINETDENNKAIIKYPDANTITEYNTINKIYDINNCNDFNNVINKIGNYEDDIYKINTLSSSNWYNKDHFRLVNPDSIIHDITEFSDNKLTFINNVNALKKENTFKNKYLKYKTKYLSLKKMENEFY